MDKRVDAHRLAWVLLARHRDEHALVGRERLGRGRSAARATRSRAGESARTLGTARWSPSSSRRGPCASGSALEGHRREAFRIAQLVRHEDRGEPSPQARARDRRRRRDRARVGVPSRSASVRACRSAADLRNAEVDQRQDDDQAVGLVDDRDADRDRRLASLAQQPGGTAFDARDELGVRDLAVGRHQGRGRARVGRVPAQGFADQRSHGVAARVPPTRSGCRSRG